MQIKPKVGFNNVRLGMTRKEVLALLGKPLSTSILKSSSKDNAEYGYEWIYSEGVELVFFNEYDYLLSEITITSKEGRFREKELIGLSEEKLKHDFSKLEIDYKFGHSVSYIDTEFELRFIVSRNNIVKEVTILPETDENGENPVWPKSI